MAPILQARSARGNELEKKRLFNFSLQPFEYLNCNCQTDITQCSNTSLVQPQYTLKSYVFEVGIVLLSRILPLPSSASRNCDTNGGLRPIGQWGAVLAKHSGGGAQSLYVQQVRLSWESHSWHARMYNIAGSIIESFYSSIEISF